MVLSKNFHLILETSSICNAIKEKFAGKQIKILFAIFIKNVILLKNKSKRMVMLLRHSWKYSVPLVRLQQSCA